MLEYKTVNENNELDKYNSKWKSKCLTVLGSVLFIGKRVEQNYRHFRCHVCHETTTQSMVNPTDTHDCRKCKHSLVPMYKDQH